METKYLGLGLGLGLGSNVIIKRYFSRVSVRIRVRFCEYIAFREIYTNNKYRLNI